MKFHNTETLCTTPYFHYLSMALCFCFGLSGLEIIKSHQNRAMNKSVRFVLIGILVLGLVLVRFFEHELFSDPLLEFYKTEFSYAEAPAFDTLQVLITTSSRFVINTIFSLAIIWLAFSSKKTLSFSVLFYGFAFVILMAIFWFFISDMKSQNYLIIFYIRRFLIQPIFLLILLPAFYYQKKTVKDK